MNEVLFSSSTDDWATPQDLFDALDAEFHFTLDPCSSEQNHKCDRYFTKEDNGLLHDWGGESVFCNPPYGKEMYKWVEKCSTFSFNVGDIQGCKSLIRKEGIN